MKISSELIQGANQYINPIKERELDLKGETYFFPKTMFLKPENRV